MRYLAVIFWFGSSFAHPQITIELARDSSVMKYHIGSYSYHEQFIGHNGYGAPLILTLDGGAAAFGDGDEGSMLVKLDQTGKEQWKRIIKPKGQEMESQSVVQDKLGNYYLFILVYDETKFRGGCERAVHVTKSGVVMWDKFMGTCNLLNSPTVNYMRTLSDGRVALRGHVVTKTPPEGKDPTY